MGLCRIAVRTELQLPPSPAVYGTVEQDYNLRITRHRETLSRMQAQVIQSRVTFHHRSNNPFPLELSWREDSKKRNEAPEKSQVI